MPSVAVPPDVAYATVTVFPLAAPRRTSNVTPAPSSALAAALASPTSGVASSSLIVLVAVPLASVAFTGPLSLSSNCSSGSSSESSVTDTDTVFSVSPAANVSVPLAAV